MRGGNPVTIASDGLFLFIALMGFHPTFSLLYSRSRSRGNRQVNCNGVVSRADRKSPPCKRSTPVLPEMGYFVRVLPFALLHRNCADAATDGRIIRNRNPVLSGMAYLSRTIPLRMQAPAGHTARFASKRHFACKPPPNAQGAPLLFERGAFAEFSLIRQPASLHRKSRRFAFPRS